MDYMHNFKSVTHDRSDPYEDADFYIQQEYMRSYTNGTSDQFEGDSIDSIREQLSQPYVGVRAGDTDENRKEFNRRFNLIINTHSEQWNEDTTPSEHRDRAFYAYRYFRLFDDIMRLYEKFPDVGSDKDYWHIVATVKRYRDRYEHYERR